MEHLNLKIDFLKLMKLKQAKKLRYQYYSREIILFNNNPQENNSMDLRWMKQQSVEDKNNKEQGFQVKLKQLFEISYWLKSKTYFPTF